MPRSARLEQKQLQITKEMIYEVLREEKLVGRLKKGNREALMLAEWLEVVHPRDTNFSRVRLGESMPNMPGALGENNNLWCDALILGDNDTTIVEAGLYADSKKIGQLEFYKEQFLKTERFLDKRTKPVRLVFLTGEEDKDLRAFTESKGIEYVVYRPKWLVNFFEQKAREG